MTTPFYDKNGITIYCGDNVEVMRAIEPRVDLTVTSPPYDNLRDYNGYSWSFEDLSKELFKATKSGGVVVWVVGDATIDGSETGTSFRQALGFMDCGFKLHDTMIWTKPNPTPIDPRQSRYTPSFEYMFAFVNGTIERERNLIRVASKTAGTIRFSGSPSQRKKNGKIRTDRIKKRWGEATKDTKIKCNVWEYPICFNKTPHPAPFPEALARDHIISWSNEGDTVLDPFLGSGTTLKACQLLGRRGIGIELSEEYCKIAVDRLRQMSFFSLPS